VELNKGAHGNYVYIGYTFTDDPAEAIRDVRVQGYKDSNKHNQPGYTAIYKDLDSGTGGPWWIYLYYTKDESAGDPLIDFGLEADGVYTFGTASPGWVPAGTFDGSARFDCKKSVPAPAP